jgi:Carboxypeptidase regulatory-like domain/TonB dependent receptor-like, beta-barrel
MDRPLSLLATALLASLAYSASADAQTSGRQGRQSEIASLFAFQGSALTAGRIEGAVTDEAGVALAGAAIVAFGPDTLFGLTDDHGRFNFAAVPIGTYLLRAQLPGFVASRRARVDVRPAGTVRHVFRLARLELSAGPHFQSNRVLAAGFAGDDESDDSSVAGPPPARATGEDDAHDHGARAWRMRHAKRSVLRDENGAVIPVDDVDRQTLSEQVSRLARLGGAAWQAIPAFGESSLTGQLRLLTTSSFDGPSDIFELGGLPGGGIAYGTVAAPVGLHGRWEVHGALTQGDIASWIVAGTYTRTPSSGHAIDVGTSYGTQYYDEEIPAALVVVTERNRSRGEVHGFDRWVASKTTVVTYGARYAWHDYLAQDGLFSPSLAVAISPARHMLIRAAASQQMLAPGAEEFAPRGTSGFVLPPQRTFAPLVPGTDFVAERTRHVEVGVEREVGLFVIGVRRFEQAVDNQLVTVFSLADEGELRSDLGHYLVAASGNLSADGWTISVGRPVGSRVRGVVEYSIAESSWRDGGARTEVTELAATAARLGKERVHDLTATVVTDVPETATSIAAVYKVNSAFAGGDPEEIDPETGLRFDVQVTQRLPFLNFSTAKWEFLVAVRNLFREPLEGASLYDELLVVRPPKRMVGGLLVRF